MMSCYYPTTIVAIDDDPGFLTAIGALLKIPKHNLYTSPSLAIKNINKADPYNRLKSKLLQPKLELHDSYCVIINPHKLHEEIYSSDRFNDISILIVDYHMGDMNGLDLCRQLADHPAKKILLTGGADKEKIAIDAFNQGIIHRYISKADKDIPALLCETTSILKENYFRDLTNRLIPHLPEPGATLIKNQVYSSLVKNLQLELAAAEYYLFDTSGSVLFISDDGSPFWLLIKSDDELDQYAEIAANSDGAEQIAQSIKNRELMPFFLSDSDFEQPAYNWKEYLYPATIIAGANGYYYSLIRGHIKSNLAQEKIISLRKHTYSLL